MVLGSDKNDVVEVLVLACIPMNSRQLASSDNTYSTGKRVYHFNMDSMTEGRRPDILVVRNKCVKSRTEFDVPQANTLLLMSEPWSVVKFPRRYTDQFGMVYSCQECVRHKHIAYGPAAIPWFVGVDLHKKRTLEYADVITYDALRNSKLPQKTREMSIIVSNKTFSAGHLKRFHFVRKLKQRYGDRIDFFGKDFKPVVDKWDALAPYKYTIAIENSSERFYFTEKIMDGFLAGCHVVYNGCTNIGDYFPQPAMTRLDIDDFEAACRTIDGLLNSDTYEKSVPDIVNARQRTLDDYNFLHIIARCCDQMELGGHSVGKAVIKPLSGIGNIPNVVNHLFVRPFYQLLGKLVRLSTRLM